MLTKEERQKIANALITYGTPSKDLIGDLTLWVGGIFDSDTLVRRAANRAYRASAIALAENMSGTQVETARLLVFYYGYNEVEAHQLVIKYMDDYDWPNANANNVATDLASRDS